MKNSVLEAVKEHFLSKVSKTDTCWIWKSYKNWQGYGRAKIGNSEFPAHRVSYELFNGNVPEDKFVLHSCDNPGCVNPNHLFLGTQDDNMKDMSSKDRSCFGEKCASHKLTEEEVREIRDLYPSISYSQLGIKYGVSTQNIAHIVKRRSWIRVL